MLDPDVGQWVGNGGGETWCAVFATRQTAPLHRFAVYACDACHCHALNVLLKMPELLCATQMGIHRNQGSGQLGSGLKIMRRVWLWGHGVCGYGMGYIGIYDMGLWGYGVCGYMGIYYMGL